jgi:trigger factor
MQTNSENVNPLEKSLDVTVPGERIAGEIAARLKRIARTAKIHGFRPGKVPLKIVEQQYGGEVQREVLSEALQHSFADAVKEQKLRVVGYPHFEAKPTPEGGQHYEFTATFEVYPEISVGDISAKSIERPVVTVGEADLDKTLEILRKQRVQYRVVGRAAQNDDKLNIDYRGMLDGVEFAGGQAAGYEMVLGEGRLLKDFEDALSGMEAGQSKTFDLTFPADYHAKDLAGKTVSFEVKLNEVAEPVLPEVDAEFAKSLGVADGDIAKMRGEIKANLEREVSKRVQARIKEQVMQTLLDATEVLLPKALVGMEVERLMHQARNDLVARGMQAKDIPLPADLFEEQAKRRVSLGLILAEIVKANDLAAKPEQVRKLVEEFAQSYEHPEEVVKWYYSNPERLGEVESLALEDNVVAWALDHAKVQDKPVGFDELMGNA